MRLLFITFSLFLISCSPRIPGKLKVGMCVEQAQKNWATYDFKKYKYKIEDSTNSSIKVSIWNRKSWLPHGDKKIDYFKETPRFAYHKIECPDSPYERRGITSRLKAIQISR